MYTIIVVAGIVVCLGALVLYLVVTFVAPEWIGITGKKSAEKTEKEPEEEKKNLPPKDFFSS